MDNFMINLLAYLLHQASLTGLTSLPKQLTHLSTADTSLSADQISKVIQYMHLMFSKK
jgi:hypothetical protein